MSHFIFEIAVVLLSSVDAVITRRQAEGVSNKGKRFQERGSQPVDNPLRQCISHLYPHHLKQATGNVKNSVIIDSPDSEMLSKRT